jgi:ferric-dicitrate binding protein FerR (iron transport regulator)
MMASVDGNGGARTITLDGEARFVVTPSDDRPFLVQTGRIATRVLGTAFTVRRYASDSVTQVAVSAGKVTSGGRGQSVTITAGRVARVTDSTAVLTTTEDAGTYTDWDRNRLVFKRTPVPELLAAVSRWYGYEFKLSSPAIAKQHVSLTISTKDAADMLVALKGTLEVDLTFDGKVITLTPRETSARDARTRTKQSQQDLTKPTMEMGR